MKSLIRKILQRFFDDNSISSHIKRGLVVGKNLQVRKEVIIDYSHSWLIEIGDDVTLAPRVHILAHDTSTRARLNYTRIGKVKIGNRVFIGASAIILPGVTIGDDCIVGAGSVVTHNIPSGSVVAGNPARVLCGTDELMEKRAKEMKTRPLYGEEYTLRLNVSASMKEKMKSELADGYGYVE